MSRTVEDLMVTVIAAITSAATTGLIEVALFYLRPRLQRRQWAEDDVPAT